MEYAAKSWEPIIPAADLDPLRAVIREQQAAIDGLESGRHELESVLQHLLSAKKILGNGHPAAAAGNGDGLSKRERQVLTLMVDGNTSKRIAAQLGIAFKTAVSHRASIMSKLGVHETASVVREAIRRGLV